MGNRVELGEIEQALRLLGVADLFVQMKRRASTLPELRAGWERVQQEASHNWKQLARRLHPDLGGDVEEMKRANAAHDLLKRIEIHEPVRPAVAVQVYGGMEVRVTIMRGGGPINSSGTVTSQGWAGWGS